MDIIRKNIEIIILICSTLLLVYVIFCPVEAASATYKDNLNETSNHLYYYKINGRDHCIGWFCIESGQSVANYFDNEVWQLTKQITKTSDDGPAWHLLGRIAWDYRKKATFNYTHDINHRNGGTFNRGQAMMWKLLNRKHAALSSALGGYTAGPECQKCVGYSDAEEKAWLKDGKKYTTYIEVWEHKTKSYVQKLIHVTAGTPVDKIKPVTLDFSKINTAGKGIAGAKLTLSSNTSGITLSSNSLTSAADGKFKTVKVTPTTNTGTFKINLTEVAPKGYLGIPNDVVLTVSYSNGSVTRNKRRNCK